MEKRQDNRHLVVRQAVAVLRDYEARLGRIASVQPVKQLAALLAEVDQAQLDQEEARVARLGATQRIDTLRSDLLAYHFDSIVFTAKARRQKEGADKWPLVERPNPKVSLRRFITQCRVVAAQARAHEAQFREYGVRFDGLETMIDALDAAVGEQGALRVQRAGTTSAIPHTLAKARKVIDLIDALIIGELKHDAPLVAAWRQAIHVPKVATRRVRAAEASEAKRLPATTSESSSVRLLITKPAEPLALPSGAPSIVRSIGARLSAPFKQLATLMKGPEERQPGS